VSHVTENGRMMAWHLGMVVNGHISQHSRLLSAFLFFIFMIMFYVIIYHCHMFTYCSLFGFVLEEKGVFGRRNSICAGC